MKITARAVTRAAAGALPAQGIVSIVPDLELAYGHGTVEVSSPDPRTPPSIELNFLGVEKDRSRLREGVRLGLELSRDPSFKGILADRVTPSDAETASDDAIDDWMMRVVRTSHHLCSSCRMGPASDPFAVTDQFGRVHGLDNLRIADASIFADVVRANTNATAILVGERIAEFVRTDLGAALETVQTDSSSS
jgi:choline dehydrogenase-like flavoprotein